MKPKYMSFIGHSGSGKTRLICRLVTFLSKKGIKIGTFKHAHHDFEMDRKGKDSHRHFNSGSIVTIVNSPVKTGIFMRRQKFDRTVNLNKYFKDCQLVLIEGMRKLNVPKIEIFRASIAKKPICMIRKIKISAIVTRTNLPYSIKRFDPENIPAIAKFVITYAK